MTLSEMSRLAHKDASSPLLGGLAFHILAPYGPAVLREWIDRRFRYVDDPPGVELVRDPLLMARAIRERGYAEGDCDDLSVLLASIGLAGGFPTRFVVVAFGPWPYEHVWPEIAGPSGEWVELDVTRPPHIVAGEGVARELVIEL